MKGLEKAGDIVLVLVTCPDEDTAGSIAHALVDERLAACVNVTAQVRSIYRWQGKVEDARERLLIVKARSDRLKALAERLVELHPYEVPELLVLPIEQGLDAYLDWIRVEGG
jgi:periplasmic divalent cation tolerance protein